MSLAVPEGPDVIKSALKEGAEVVDVQLHLPRNVAKQVLEVLEAQDSGGAHVVPLKEEYTTTEAAQILRMSRPTLMRFIKRDEISHRMVGQHHRIPADALEAFRKQFRAEQATAAWDIAEISNLSNHF